jgi:hypothetical protein
LETRSKTIKFKELVSGKDHFYLMHMNYENRSKEEELWNFARKNHLIGLDNIRVRGDWTTLKHRVKKNLRTPWPLQFDMLCENMHPKSMINNDIVVVMAGYDSVLGIAEVSGPHRYKPEYYNGVFFDHI